jgi:sugar/nucleoside kinase (ribokinase family)
MPAIDIVVAGHLCLDITPKFLPTGGRTLAQLLTPGTLLNTGECVVSTGGPVSNTGVALRTLGANAVLMGKVGDDDFGRVVREKMAGWGCADGILVDPRVSTSYTIVLAVPGYDRIFLHHPAANDTFSSADPNYETMRQARAFHFGYPTLMHGFFADGGRELIEMFRRARETGVTTSLDTSLPDPHSPSGQADWDTILRTVLPNVDLFLPSAEEVLFFLDREAFLRKRTQAAATGGDSLDLIAPEEYSRLSDQLLSYGAGVVALKSGHRGFYVRTAGQERLKRFGRAQVGDLANWADRELWEPIYDVERVVSATGSGDSSIAGFLTSFLRGERIEQALNYATAAGKQNVMVHDAVSGIKSFAETTALLADWKKRDMRIDAPGWRIDGAGPLWHGPNDRG